MLASMARIRTALTAFALLLLAVPAAAQAPQSQPASEEAHSSRLATTAKFVAGGAAGLLAHESGHLLFNVAFDAQPHVRRVEFHGIPFFAISPRADLSPAREFVISSAGFWVQHAGSEWLLTAKPQLRRERAPFMKGLLAFNVLASAAYAGAAFARTGPPERDTRGMAASSRVNERWIGVMVLAPAVLDAWRYYDPNAKWARWASRGAKIGLVLLTIRARTS